MEKVSICMPTYNGEKYIKQTIDSILNQSFKDYEVIFVDDGSTDDTCKIIESYNNKKFRLIKEKNSGSMVKNWNRCFKYAKGEYIIFVFQDDLIAKDCLEKKVKLLDENPDVVFCYSASSIINDEGNKIITRRYFNKDTIIDGKDLISRSFNRGENIFGEPSNILFRKEICDKAGAFCDRLNYTPDLEYYLKIVKYGKVAYINEDLTNFRISSSSMTYNLFKNYNRIISDDEIFIEEFINYHGKENVSVFMHRLCTRLRSYAKLVFLLFTRYKEIIKYLIFGVLTTLLSWLIYFVLTILLLNPNNPVELQIANVISWIGGVLFSYVTSRKIVFNSKEKNIVKEFFKFIATRISVLIMDMLIMGIGVSVLKFDDKILKIVSTIVVIIVNYIFSKLIVFKKKKE
jgi:glycosyltransferase involved in cell wall biosynthesis